MGELEFTNEFQIVIVKKNLVSTIPTRCRGHGCGGVVNEAVINPLIDELFELPAPAGQSVTSIKGNLFNSTAEATRLSEK